MGKPAAPYSTQMAGQCWGKQLLSIEDWISSSVLLKPLCQDRVVKA